MSDELGQTYVNAPIVCLTCGYEGGKPVKESADGRLVDICRCPKCSQKAYVMNPLRSRFLLAAMAKEIVSLRLALMDLEGLAEEVHQMQVSIGHLAPEAKP